MLDPALHPEFDFVSVRDAISGEVAAVASGNNIILAMNEAMEASTAIDEVLASVIADEMRTRPACIIINSNLLAVQKAASRLGLPTLALHTRSAACLGCFLAFPKLYKLGYLPCQVKELPPLRVRDLFFSIYGSHEKVRKVLAHSTKTVRNSLVWSSTHSKLRKPTN